MLKRKRVLALLVICASSVLPIQPAAAGDLPPASVSELDVIEKIEPAILRRVAEVVRPDASGAVGNNQTGFIEMQWQARSADVAYDALARRDPVAIGSALRILEYGFRHKQGDGSFEFNEGNAVVKSGTKASPLGRAGSLSFFYYDLGHTLCLLRQSSWFQTDSSTKTLRARVASVESSARPGLSWLLQQAPILKTDRAAVNRTFVQGLAYYLVGKDLGQRAAMSTGLEFLHDAVNRQDSQGVFPESGGFDSSYQSVSLFLAQIFFLQLSNSDADLRPPLWSSIERAAARERLSILSNFTVSSIANSRVRAGGERFYGQEKPVSAKDVTMALTYYGQLTGDQGWKNLALGVVHRYHIESP